MLLSSDDIINRSIVTALIRPSLLLFLMFLANTAHSLDKVLKLAIMR